MTWILLQFLLSAGVIVVAGTVLTRAADRIADLTGLGRLLIGTVLLAAGTSLPEIGVGVSAALHGLEDVTVGNLAGASLMNLLVLAIADLMHRSKTGMLSRASAAHAISGTMSLLLAALAGLALVLRSGIGFAGVGLGSTVLFIAYALSVRIIYYDKLYAEARTPDETPIPRRGSRRFSSELRWALARFSAAALAILIVAPFLTTSAGELAAATGLGETFVGTTLVALATTLPETTTTIASVRMGAFDLAIGNIFGSNAFNLSLLFVVDLFSKGPLLSTVSPTHAVTFFWVVIITAVAVVGQLYHVERRRPFLEPDALLVITLVLLALLTVYRLG